jgi:hypothetical protein
MFGILLSGLLVGGGVHFMGALPVGVPHTLSARTPSNARGRPSAVLDSINSAPAIRQLAPNLDVGKTATPEADSAGLEVIGAAGTVLAASRMHSEAWRPPTVSLWAAEVASQREAAAAAVWGGHVQAQSEPGLPAGSNGALTLYGDIRSGVGGHSRGTWSMFDVDDLHGAISLQQPQEGGGAAAAATAGAEAPAGEQGGGDGVCTVEGMEALATVADHVCMFEAEEFAPATKIVSSSRAVVHGPNAVLVDTSYPAGYPHHHRHRHHRHPRARHLSISFGCIRTCTYARVTHLQQSNSRFAHRPCLTVPPSGHRTLFDLLFPITTYGP